jgi:hypothetical protein
VPQASAAAELELAKTCGAFDAFVVNDTPDGGYASLKEAISRFRPDLIPPPACVDSGGGAGSARDRGPQQRAAAPLLLLCGPAGGGREAVAAQLLSRLPGAFAVPARVTDRKPATPPAGPAGSARGSSVSGTAASAAGGAAAPAAAVDPEVVKPEALAKLAAAGQLAAQWQDAAGAAVALTLDALKATAAAGAGREAALRPCALKHALSLKPQQPRLANHIHSIMPAHCAPAPTQARWPCWRWAAPWRSHPSGRRLLLWPTPSPRCLQWP